jgi:hypothetical protein
LDSVMSRALQLHSFLKKSGRLQAVKSQPTCRKSERTPTQEPTCRKSGKTAVQELCMSA